MTEIFEAMDLIVDSKDKDFDRKVLTKELGVNCDSVGWTCLDLGKDIDKLKQISELAKNKGLKLRGTYTKKDVGAFANYRPLLPYYKMGGGGRLANIIVF